MPRAEQENQDWQQGKASQPERQGPVRRGGGDARDEQGYGIDARMAVDSHMGVSPEDVADDAFVSAALMEAYNGPDAVP
ncbi:MAG: hypothetical protein ACYC5Y_10140 [Symbiobacteriia bacterium]